MLSVENLRVQYGAFAALQDVTLSIKKGQVVSIVGANGAGKTTLINTISGLLRAVSGQILFEDQDLLHLEGHTIATMGIAQVPEGRKLFTDMTVYENLLMGSYSSRAKADRERSLEMVFELFPILKSRDKQLARTLSGGPPARRTTTRSSISTPPSPGQRSLSTRHCAWGRTSPSRDRRRRASRSVAAGRWKSWTSREVRHFAT